MQRLKLNRKWKEIFRESGRVRTVELGDINEKAGEAKKERKIQIEE